LNAFSTIFNHSSSVYKYQTLFSTYIHLFLLLAPVFDRFSLSLTVFTLISYQIHPFSFLLNHYHKMPAVSAEKRARQRANKLLRMEPKATVTTVVSDTPLSTSIDFNTFIDLADLSDVLRFCDAVASTQEGRNLKCFWDRAFEAGLDQGRTEEYRRGEEERKEMYFKGKAKGIEEAEEAARRVNIDLYSHGIEKGRTEEQLVWTSKGHGLHCFSPVAVLSDQIIQTDPEQLPSAPRTTDSMIQTDSSSSASISMQTEPISKPPTPTIVASAPFNWADDAASLPAQNIPSSLPPRDLSGLRSSKSNPFSSLQHRSKRFTHHSHQSHRHRSRFNFNSFYSPHHNSFKPTPPHSHLDWESDPRLFDLSRSLKALGWIRPP
jgi:hypothetical protein